MRMAWGGGGRTQKVTAHADPTVSAGFAEGLAPQGQVVLQKPGLGASPYYNSTQNLPNQTKSSFFKSGFLSYERLTSLPEGQTVGGRGDTLL